MGVTIHFEGKLRDVDSFASSLTIARSLADRWGWPCDEINEPYAKLKRVRDEEARDYEGRVAGIVIYPSEDCDPLRLEFDDQFYVQEYCKTQFAGQEIHIRVTELLRSVRPLFLSLNVYDEGEYWETGSIEALTQHMSNFYKALQDELKKYPHAKTKVKLPNGRIIDLMA